MPDFISSVPSAQDLLIIYHSWAKVRKVKTQTGWQWMQNLGLVLVICILNNAQKTILSQKA